MIRELVIAVFFFFGPALVMVVLRNLVLLLLLRAKQRREKAHEPEVIDITPVDESRTPFWFYAMVVAVSLTCAVFVFMLLEQKTNHGVHQYVPAHSDKSGKIVPGHWRNEPQHNQSLKN